MTLTGKSPPMMPEYGMGFWQRKPAIEPGTVSSGKKMLKELGVPLDVIVVDFPLTKQASSNLIQILAGCAGYVPRIKGDGNCVVVSVWPTVDIYSENWRDEREGPSGSHGSTYR